MTTACPTLTISIPDAILLMAQRIAADKFEHCTADPIFTVMRRELITGLDLDYDCEVGWFYDGEQITGDDASKLETTYQDTCKVPDNYTRTGIAEKWEHFATYVTAEAAQEFVAKKGGQYRVYVNSGCRNHEWQALRAFLLEIANAPTAAPAAGDALDAARWRAYARLFPEVSASFLATHAVDGNDPLPTIKGASITGGYIIVTPAGWDSDKATKVRDAILRLFPVNPAYTPQPSAAQRQRDA
jgi:hypothetical protein